MAVPLTTSDLFFDSLLRELKGQLTREAALAASNDAVSRITERVQRKGLDQDLQQFSPYSSSYADIRKEAGRQTAYKDFTFTARTFSSVQTLQATVDGDRTIVVIDSNNQTGRDIIRWNSEREGKAILAPTAQEIKQAGQIYVNEVVRRLERVLVK